MSADNWAVCPRCKQDAIRAREDKQLAADKAYGTAPPEEYLAMLKAIDGPLVFAETFRENYEQGVRDGIYYVGYHGKCSECGLTHKFKHEQPLSF
jgi:hypothetical protein